MSDMYTIKKSTLDDIAKSIQEVRGETTPYTPEGMPEKVTSMLGATSYLLVDESGNEFPAVFAEDDVVFDATADDIRLGKVAATASGVTVGKYVARMFDSVASGILPAVHKGVANSEFTLNFKSSAVGALANE